jgi:outer membrane cobalamin receptor
VAIAAWGPAAVARADAPVEVPPVLVPGDPAPLADRDSTGQTDVFVLDAAELGTSSAAAVLEGAPGVQLRSDGGPGRAIRVSLRGTDSQQTAVLLDDVPVVSSIGGGFDLSLVDLGAWNRLELYRGGSARFGASAIGGAIRLVSAAPADRPTTHAALRGGSWGSAALAASFGAPVGPVGVFGAFSLVRSDGDFPFVDTNGAARTRDNNDSSRIATTVRVRGDVSPGLSLTVSSQHTAIERGVPGVEQFPTRLARSEGWFHLASVRLASDPGAFELFDWGATAWVRAEEMRLRDPAPYLPPPTDNTHAVQQVGATGWTTFYPDSVQAIEIRAEAGFEWARIDRSGSVSHPERATAGLVVTDTLELAQGALTLEPTVRVDWAEGAGVEVVPRLGAAVRPTEWLELRASGGRAYRLPTFEELYYDAGSTRGNPDLDPESAWSADASIGVAWPAFRARAAGFFLHIDNLILFLPTTAFLYEASGSKAARSAGVELEVEAAPCAYLDARLSYTFVDARFIDTGQLLPARSPHLVRGRAVGHAPFVDLWFEAAWQDAFTLDRYGQLKEEGRLILSAGAEARPHEALRLGVEVRNLLDDRGHTDALQQPLPGLTAIATASVAIR